jgi:hypothetical protein
MTIVDTFPPTVESVMHNNSEMLGHTHHHSNQDNEINSNNTNHGSNIFSGPSLHVALKAIAVLFQVTLILIVIILGLVSSITSRVVHVQIYTGLNFIVATLSLMKYGIVMTDPVILILNTTLLILSFVILRKVMLMQQLQHNYSRQNNQSHIECLQQGINHIYDNEKWKTNT